MADLTIRPESVKESPSRFEFESGAAWWEDARVVFGEEGLELRAPFHASLDGYRLGNRLLFRGRVQGAVQLDCGRCAAPFRLDLDEPLEILLEPAPRHAELPASGIELDPEDIEIGQYTGDELDFGPLFLEIVSLAWPMQPRCSESCRGVCPACGRNRNEEACNCESEEASRPFAGLDKLLEESRKGPRSSGRSGH